MLSISINNKAQAWLIDLIIGLLVFVAAFAVYQNYVVSSIGNAPSLDSILNDARRISSSLVSGGYPQDWSNKTVIRLGITDGNYRLNDTKLQNAINLSYSRQRYLLNARYDFFVFFTDGKGCTIELKKDVFGFGNQNVGIKNKDDDDEENEDSECDFKNAKNVTLDFKDINYKKLVKVQRLLISNSRLSNMAVYVWQ